MKRIFAVLMSTALVLSLAACGQSAKTPEEIYDGSSRASRWMPWTAIWKWP